MTAAIYFVEAGRDDADLDTGAGNTVGAARAGSHDDLVGGVGNRIGHGVATYRMGSRMIGQELLGLG